MTYVQWREEVAIVSIDILNMRKFDDNDQAIDIALPILAVECEATPPLNNYLDAYEEAVLKLVSLGLSTSGIAKTLNATESLVEEILAHLEDKKYAYREIGKPWRLTEDGEKYLNGSIEERTSSESQFGYMFVNAIKKEVLPYFYPGDVGKISLFRGVELPLKLTSEGDEITTFSSIDIKNSKLKKAYKTYFKNLEIIGDYDDGEISKQEAEDLFADLESFDEEIEDSDESEKRESRENDTSLLKGNMFIRALNKKPTKLYLRMRIIIDPSYPGGYKAESPFDFDGIDNNYFLRQIQWLEESENAYINGEVLQDFLQREICKISPSYKNAAKDFQVFVLERIPRLKIYRARFPYIYEDMERIYALIQKQQSLLEKENIVNNLARCVVEGLFNAYFRAIDSSKLNTVKQNAIDDVKAYGYVAYKKRICRNAHLDEDTLHWINSKYLNTILGRMSNTYGNSIMEKFINMLAIEYHLGDRHMHKFVAQKDITHKYNLIDKLNRIRRKVSHDTDEKFTNEDYEFYMANVFELVDNLLEAFGEE